MRPQQSREAEVRGFPVFEGRLLVLILELDHITPNLCLCPHRQSGGGRGEDFDCLSDFTALRAGGGTQMTGDVWCCGFIPNISAPSETCKTLDSYQ